MGLHINLGQNISFTFFLDDYMGILCSSYCLSSKIMEMRMYHDTAFSFPFAALSEWRGCGSYHMVINNAPTLCSGPGILLNDCFTDCSQRKLFHYLCTTVIHSIFIFFTLRLKLPLATYIQICLTLRIRITLLYPNCTPLI